MYSLGLQFSGPEKLAESFLEVFCIQDQENVDLNKRSRFVYLAPEIEQRLVGSTRQECELFLSWLLDTPVGFATLSKFDDADQTELTDFAFLAAGAVVILTENVQPRWHFH